MSLKDFIADHLQRVVEEASRSKGYSGKAEDFFYNTFREAKEEIYAYMKKVLNKYKLTDENGYDLLLWDLTGDIPEGSEDLIEDYDDVAIKLDYILSDYISNWLTEGMMKGKRKKR